MIDPHDSPADEVARQDRLEAYLDGLLDQRDRAAFAEDLRRDSALARQADLQSRIDEALGRLYHVEQPSREQVAAALAGAASSPAATVPFENRAALVEPSALPPTPARGTRLYWTASAVAAAAAVAWAMIAGPWGARREEPLFAARPLVEIYQDAVASGFEPTYECHEPERFAATFSERQGQPLRLLEMPSGSRMLGLAYVGGLSRQTTAMLCLVEGQPVMAFVDRAGADQPQAADVGGTTLNVFRQERDGLVFYEVTPFDEPQVLQRLSAPATAADTAA